MLTGCLVTSHHLSRDQQAFGLNSWHSDGRMWKQRWPRQWLPWPPELTTDVWGRDLFSILSHSYETSLQVPKHSGNFMKTFQPHSLPQREHILPFHMSPCHHPPPPNPPQPHRKSFVSTWISSIISLFRWYYSSVYPKSWAVSWWRFWPQCSEKDLGLGIRCTNVVLLA